MTDATRPADEPEPPDESRRRSRPRQPLAAERRSSGSRSGSAQAAIVAPLITTLHRLPDGRPRRRSRPGKNPFKVYHAIFNGTGSTGSSTSASQRSRPVLDPQMRFPCDTASIAAQNLQQTLLLTTPIILTGLAVAFAFRCGMFNIGGQGQYFAGTIFAVWLGSSFAQHGRVAARPLCIVLGALAGARLRRASPGS